MRSRIRKKQPNSKDPAKAGFFLCAGGGEGLHLESMRIMRN